MHLQFDFFTEKSFSTSELYGKIDKIFATNRILKIQDDQDTLTILIDNSVKVSFFAYPYSLIKPLAKTEYFRIALIEDIACLKFSAITRRTVKKDYVDLHFILQKISLSEILTLAKIKFPSLDTNLILKSLVYFDDLINEPINYKHDHEIDFEIVKKSLRNSVKSYLG